MENEVSEKKIKALVVDDQIGVVDFLSKTMESMGVETIKAYDGEMGLNLFMGNSPDIVFTDIMMPKMNGILLLKKIKSINSGIPVIVFTGYSHFRSMVQEQKNGPDNFLMKPLEVKQIIEIMLEYFPVLRKS